MNSVGNDNNNIKTAKGRGKRSQVESQKNAKKCREAYDRGLPARSPEAQAYTNLAYVTINKYYKEFRKQDKKAKGEARNFIIENTYHDHNNLTLRDDISIIAERTAKQKLILQYEMMGTILQYVEDKIKIPDDLLRLIKDLGVDFREMQIPQSRGA